MIKEGQRKLLAFVVACLLLVFGKITVDAWEWVTIAFMGANVLEHFSKKGGSAGG